LLRAGDFVACPPRMVHAEGRKSAGQSFTSAWFGLAVDDPSLHVMRYTRRGGYVMPCALSLRSVTAEARAAVTKLREWVTAPRMLPADPAKAALLTLTLEAYRRILVDGRAGTDRREVLVRRAAGWVRDQAGEPLSLEQVARVIGVSPNYLTTLFREVLGISLGRFIMQERINRAKQLLRDRERAVKDVAFELGFPDAYAFSRAFKSQTGLAPSRWADSDPA